MLGQSDALEYAYFLELPQALPEANQSNLKYALSSVNEGNSE
jgi:hypothetical protein